MPQLLPLRLLETVGLRSSTAADPRAGSAEPPTGVIDVDPAIASTGPLSIIAPRRIGESDLAVYPLSLGASVFGWTADGDTSLAILDRFTELGGDFIDTADSYVGGRSEVLIGKWMRERRNRDRMVVATKVGRHHDNPGLGSVSMIRAVEASLERLQTDHIDLLYFHEDDPETPLEDSLATAEWLIESGKVRYLGASNFSADRLIEARILASSGLPKFVAIQTQYNLMHRSEFESAPRIVAAAQGLAVMPYYALANGFLTGKYRSKGDLTAGARSVRAAAYVNRRGQRVLAVLDRIAAEHHVAPASIALAWLLAKRTIAAPVASASRPDQVDALMAAAGIRLTRSQMLDLDRVSE
ncbi:MULTISPECIES: aldo/keto reductase [Microbacteriaceae]|jgi:aryl-alcohol dehydrogenase-like predicted oxidoreductase|uniref:aldo/keto reductase n=1 Tax=Microbacteriaceae TaxID=85023 RepID=UPI00037A4BBC|nr:MULTISPECIES: aldo/keto reductase [Microbacteriaceae]MDR6614292.1 aryl-alcohol dehydrogenase-like predicted oxidoreductase [Leifsonia sp. 1010]